MQPEGVAIDYEQIFQAMTTPCAIFSPDMRILDVNRAYLDATGANREAIVGHYVFEAFPADPARNQMGFAESLRGSVERALATGLPDTMPVLRYDVPGESGDVEHFWSVVNIAVPGPSGEISVLLHRADDVTVLFGRRTSDQDGWRPGAGERAPDATADSGLLTRAHDVVRAANRDLGDAKRRLERAAREQALVARLGQYALSAADGSHLLEQVLATVRSLPDVEFCEVLERAGGDRLVPRARAGWPAEETAPGGVAVLEGSFARFALEAPDPVVVDDVASDDRFAAPDDLLRHGVVSAATARIGDPDEPFGILAAYSRARHAFTGAEGNFLLAVANVLAAGLQRSRREAEMRRLALHDHLTGLPGRKLLMDRLGRELAAARRAGRGGAFALIDIDDFKGINDTLGHAAGDVVLRGVAERLSATLRDADTVARLGGDEFALLLPDVTTHAEAAVVAGKALEAVRATPVASEDRHIDTKASLGMVLFPEHGSDRALLLRRADAAMYAAKRAGTGHAIYKPEHDEHRQRRTRDVADLRRALARGELFVEYQPKLDLATQSVCSLEVLARWTDPTGGAIPPSRFIPLAEETGLIREVTDQVLTMAMEQARRWRDEGLAVPLAVNLSATCVHDATLIDTVMGALDHAGVPAEALELEITETAVMANPGASMTILGELAAAGIHVSLDDFGTGYSSLAYLKRLPLRELKLDRSFVPDLCGSERDASIVNAVIDMAHSLGLLVVGEGIETEAVFRALRERGCDRGQGYYFQRPLPADEMTRWLRERRRAGAGPAA